MNNQWWDSLGILGTRLVFNSFNEAKEEEEEEEGGEGEEEISNMNMKWTGSIEQQEET